MMLYDISNFRFKKLIKVPFSITFLLFNRCLKSIHIQIQETSLKTLFTTYSTILFFSDNIVEPY